MTKRPVPPIRVLIFPMPRLLHDILHQLILEVPEVELIECPALAGGLAEAAQRTRADVVIANEADVRPSEACTLLEQMPRSRALAVSHDGHRGVIYELRPHRRTIGELSAGTVRAAVSRALPCPEFLISESPTRPAP